MTLKMETFAQIKIANMTFSLMKKLYSNKFRKAFIKNNWKRGNRNKLYQIKTILKTYKVKMEKNKKGKKKSKRK